MADDKGDDAVASRTRAAVVDLLGVLAYGELTAFDRLAADAHFAPTLGGRAALAQMAGAEMGHFARLAQRLTEMGVDPDAAMTPFVRPLDAYHDSTRPSTWLEGLVKAYVGDGLAKDFYREVAGWLDPSSRDLVLEVLSDTGHAAFAVREVRAAIAHDPTLTGRLALWARRLLGEALSQAQHAAADREALAQLIIEGSGDLAGVGVLFDRLIGRHAERMRALGLSS